MTPATNRQLWTRLKTSAVWLTAWLVTLVVTLFMAASAWATEVIKVGSTPGPMTDAIQALIPEARAQGLDVKLVEFSDGTLPNEAVNNGDIDLNFFQHQPYLNNAIKERGYKLKMVSPALLQNIGIYSNRYQRLADVPDGAKVAVPSDPVNQGRGLLLLQKAGFIKLRNGTATGASINDVVDNPKRLRIIEVDGPQLIRALNDVDLAIVWPSYFKDAGKTAQAGQALIYAGIDDVFYAMGFVARADRASDPKILKFIQIYQNSPKVRAVIDADFNHDPHLYTLPWKH